MLTWGCLHCWRWTWRDCRTGCIRRPEHKGGNNRTGPNRSPSRDRFSSPAPARWRSPNRAPAWCPCSAIYRAPSGSCAPARRSRRRTSAGSQSHNARGRLLERGGPSSSACRKNPVAWVTAANRRISPSPTAGCSSVPAGCPGCRRRRGASPWRCGRDRPARSSWWCCGAPGCPGCSGSGWSTYTWACLPGSAGPAGIPVPAGNARTERWRPPPAGTRGRSPGRGISVGWSSGAWAWADRTTSYESIWETPWEETWRTWQTPHEFARPVP